MDELVLSQQVGLETTIFVALVAVTESQIADIVTTTTTCPGSTLASHCPFCSLPPDRETLVNGHAIAIRDGYPLSLGHTLIIPRRHVGSFFDISDAERADLMQLLTEARDALEREFAPAGFSIRVNDGTAAGQTVPHLHIHLIPRYEGDCEEGHGGVRWVLTEAGLREQGVTGDEVRDLTSPPPYTAGSLQTARPTPDEQVRFIANIERILSEGSFVATYKYALLVALVDLAIERGDDTGAALPLRIDELAEKFAELYWRQAAPYGPVGARVSGFTLHQNHGKQATAIRMLSNLRGLAGTLADARRSPHWRPLISAMRQLLRAMPLWRLQKVAHDELIFLYEPGPTHGWITLLPGVACQLRDRATLIRRLAQTEWLRFVLSLKQNQGVLGAATGLSDFLFGSSRVALGLKLSHPLRELQHERCIYCEGRLMNAAVVDHFIPWSRYPRDLVHNLVLAHARCNAQKSDLLGSEAHLERWTRFVADEDTALSQIGGEVGLLVDRATSVAVAEWSYEQAERVHAPVWLGGKQFVHLSSSWRRYFAVGGS